MTNQITDVANNFSTTLTQQVGPDSVTFPVADRGGLTSPCYITIAPDDPNKREVVLCDGTFGATSFETSNVINRAQEGSAPGAPFLHEVDTPVVVSPLAQHIDDLNDRISQHAHAGADTGVPLDHGSLTGRADDDHPAYVLVTGTRAFSGPVAGQDPTGPNQLTTKRYVDDADAAMAARLDTLEALPHSGYVLTDGSRSMSVLDVTGGVTIGADSTINGALQMLADGSAAEPALRSPSGNDGIYWLSNTVSVAVDGASKMSVTTAGMNVNGIISTAGGISIESSVLGANEVQVSNGSLSDPSYTFTSATNTGIYLDGSSNLVLARGGSICMRLGSTSVVAEKELQIQSGSVANPSLSFEAATTTGLALVNGGVSIVDGGNQVAFFTVNSGERRMYLGGETNDWLGYDPTSEVFRIIIGSAPKFYAASNAIFTGDHKKVAFSNHTTSLNDYISFNDSLNDWDFFTDGATANGEIWAGAFRTGSDRAIKSNVVPMGMVRRGIRGNVVPIEYDHVSDRVTKKRVSAGTAQQWQDAMGLDWPGVIEHHGVLNLDMASVDAALLAYCHELSDALDDAMMRIEALEAA